MLKVVSFSIKHAYHPIGNQYSETRYNNNDCFTANGYPENFIKHPVSNFITNKSSNDHTVKDIQYGPISKQVYLKVSKVPYYVDSYTNYSQRLPLGPN